MFYKTRKMMDDEGSNREFCKLLVLHWDTLVASSSLAHSWLMQSGNGKKNSRDSREAEHCLVNFSFILFSRLFRQYISIFITCSVCLSALWGYLYFDYPSGRWCWKKWGSRKDQCCTVKFYTIIKYFKVMLYNLNENEERRACYLHRAPPPTDSL